MSDTEYSIIWFYAGYSCCPFVLLNSFLYDFILGMVYYGIIFINRKTARKRHNSWGFAVTSFWGMAIWAFLASPGVAMHNAPRKQFVSMFILG